MLKEKDTISSDDVMGKNYQKERLDVSHWSWKNVKYRYGKLSIVHEEEWMLCKLHVK